MLINEASLAHQLRTQIAERIANEMDLLVATPDQRRAGRIEALKDVLAMIDGEYAKANDSRSPAPKT